MNATVDLQPGLLVLQGNRFELLREAVFEWIGRHPLGPLEEEIFLVQSNGVAEWIKMALAERRGVCAATRVELPARFLWRSFRQVLGRAEVPSQSPLDRTALTWRLMGLLPRHLGRPGFEPLARFLSDTDLLRRLQLCQRLADLFDQYQVYRSDWLDAWAEGRDTLPGRATPRGQPVPAEQRWQPLLWRELLAQLTPAERRLTRPELHRRFMARLASGEGPEQPVARRVVVFGMSHLPLQTLQALSGLSEHAQVLLAVPNPCRYHWADILGPVAGLSGAPRHPFREGHDLSAIAPHDMHAHAHPLLAAWGRQGGDFIRQLEAFDDARAVRQRFALPQVDLFDDGPGLTLLEQVQARIRDLVPLAEHACTTPASTDRSIVFHVAHSPQREVEVLHDQLLALLADPPGGGSLAPRDVVVMLPDVETFAPAIRAVFGQYPRTDARHIPFDIADVADRAGNPLVVAVDWLLHFPHQRCRLSDVHDLLDVPAIAARFGLDAESLPLLTHWMTEAGVRWGLSGQQRGALGLEACGEQNTWMFGLRRMLLGYANGDGDPGGTADTDFAGIEPYGEVGGLDAALAGSMATLVDRLIDWWTASLQCSTPVGWAGAARALLDDFADPTDDAERIALDGLRHALQRWLEACDAAGFDEALPLSAFREAWLSGLDEPGLGHRFLGGGVTFCTLVPMRSIPFEVVCLLGMNDGDFPRAAARNDFDLMALAGNARPGDRSRRDDDRQLMLEALLSARRVLYLSWTGRSARDNSELPPSVLVSQLRDYLRAGWSPQTLAERTTEHPLQPFSRRYFEGGEAGLFTHAREWRAAHLSEATPPLRDVLAEGVAQGSAPPWTVQRIAAFLRNPVRDFFRHQLDVVFSEADESPKDEEAFDLGGLEEHEMVRELIAEADAADPAEDPLPRLLGHMQRLQRAGRLPVAALGDRRRDELVAAAAPLWRCWQGLRRGHPEPAPAQPLVGGGRAGANSVALEDWLAPWLPASPGAPLQWRERVPSRLLDSPSKKGVLRGELLLPAWVRSVAAGASGLELQGVLVGRDAAVFMRTPPAHEAQPLLDRLLAVCEAGARDPLPVACATALAWLEGGDEAAEKAYEGGDQRLGEVRDACLARLYPDYAALSADGRFAALARDVFEPFRHWLREQVRVQRHEEGGDA